jgi:putative ABC transport system ATP-binding protein
MVRLENVRKEYRIGKAVTLALDGINLQVGDGEFLAIAGPSGSGKSTALNMIGCIDRPDTGRIFIDEVDIGGLSGNEMAGLRSSKIGFIFQSFNLLPVLTAFENVEYPLLNREFRKEERLARAEYALECVGLQKFMRHKPLELSGGQQQRVAIARSIAGSPELILADEPTANLDHKTGEEILELMKKINQERETTFIFSTHDKKVMDMATRVVHLWDGKVV